MEERKDEQMHREWLHDFSSSEMKYFALWPGMIFFSLVYQRQMGRKQETRPGGRSIGMEETRVQNRVDTILPFSFTYKDPFHVQYITLGIYYITT